MCASYFTLNICVGIVNGHLVGSHFLAPRLNGKQYQRFLEYVLLESLKEVPLVKILWPPRLLNMNLLDTFYGVN